jgi:hypothetical protein
MRFKLGDLSAEIDESSKINASNLTQANEEEIDIENEFQIQPLNEAYQKYYDTIVSIILGDTDNEEEDNDELFMVD